MRSLFVDNEQRILGSFATFLKEIPGYDLEYKVSLKEGIDYYYDRPIHYTTLVLCQKYRHCTALELIKDIREKGFFPYIIVLVEPKCTHKEKVALMTSGASAIMDLPGHPIELQIALSQAQDTKIILENLNRDLYFKETFETQRYLNQMQDIIENREGDLRLLMPNQIQQIFLNHCKGGFELRKPRVITVDDESHITSLMKRIFHQDFDIIKASNGEEAYKFLKERPADIMLLDIEMPGKTGEKWIGQFLNTTPNLNIIVVTAHYDDTKLIVDSIRAGAKDYISKPFKPREIFEKVSRLSRIKQLQDQLHASRGTSPLRYAI